MAAHVPALMWAAAGGLGLPASLVRTVTELDGGSENTPDVDLWPLHLNAPPTPHMH